MCGFSPTAYAVSCSSFKRTVNSYDPTRSTEQGGVPPSVDPVAVSPVGSGCVSATAGAPPALVSWAAGGMPLSTSSLPPCVMLRAGGGQGCACARGRLGLRAGRRAARVRRDGCGRAGDGRGKWGSECAVSTSMLQATGEAPGGNAGHRLWQLWAWSAWQGPTQGGAS